MLCESVWKSFSGSPTHWTMFALGGVLFLILGELNEHLPWEMGLMAQMGIGATVITAAELIAGLVLNVWFDLGIWDYSHLPYNLMGQICLPFFGLWWLLSGIGIVLDDYLRYWLWGEEKPHYKLI